MHNRLTVIPLFGYMDAAGMLAQNRQNKGWKKKSPVNVFLWAVGHSYIPE